MPKTVLFRYFGRFLRMRTIIDFWMRLQWTKKSEKSAQVAAKGLFAVNGELLFGSLGPRAAPFHARAYHGKRKNGSFAGTLVLGSLRLSRGSCDQFVDWPTVALVVYV